MYIIRYDDTAFVGMVMNSIEAFFLPMRNAMRRKEPQRKDYGHEIFGHIYGKIDESSKDRIYTIENCNIATTAKTTDESTYVTEETFLVKESIREALAPEMKYLGTFHTHPHRAQDLEECPPKSYLVQACKPTKADVESDPLEIPYMLDTILSVSNRKKPDMTRTGYVNGRTWSMVEFHIGKLSFILSADVRSEKKGYMQDSEVKIEIPRMINKDLNFMKDSYINELLDDLL